MANKQNSIVLLLVALLALLVSDGGQASAMAIRSRGRFPFADPEALAASGESEQSVASQAANLTSNETASESMTANESVAVNESAIANESV